MGIRTVPLSTDGSFQPDRRESEEEHLVIGSRWGHNCNRESRREYTEQRHAYLPRERKKKSENLTQRFYQHTQ